MIDEQEFRRLKDRAEKARQTRDKAAGQLEAAVTRLQDEFGCETIEAAEAMIEKLDKETAQAEKAYNEAVETFEAEWSEYAEQD